MRIGLVYERKADFPRQPTDPADIDSELISEQEEDELLSGLRDAGHEVHLIRGAKRLLGRIGYWRKRCDLAFNLSVGYRGSERALQAPALLEAAGIPYIGSTPYVHELVHNKHHAKLVVAAAGLATPAAVVVRPGFAADLREITFPAIVKPLSEGSSLGVEQGKSVVDSAGGAEERARELIRRYDQPALIEAFVRGVEVEVPITVDPIPRALGAVAITISGKVVAGDEYLASDAAYIDDYGFADLPADVDENRVIDAGMRAAHALGMRDYGRVDFRISSDGTPWFIEAETLPHIQRHSSFFFLAKRRGKLYHEMLDDLVAIAIKRIRGY